MSMTALETMPGSCRAPYLTVAEADIDRLILQAQVCHMQAIRLHHAGFNTCTAGSRGSTHHPNHRSIAVPAVWILADSARVIIDLNRACNRGFAEN